MSVINTRYGQLEVIESDFVVSHSLRVYGEWAQDEIKLLAQLIMPGACVLDVGAFIGTHTLAFSRFVGSEGKIYSFEPRREIFDVLLRNINLNRCENVSALNLALADRPATLVVAALNLQANNNFGALPLNDKTELNSSNVYDVEVTTIDHLKLKKVELIKIDVEGMENEVIIGATETISRNRPVIFTECNSLTAGSALLDFCKTSEYAAYGCLSGAFFRDNFNKIEDNIFGDAKELGLLLIPKEKVVFCISLISDRVLPLISNPDDLVLLLLHKPQYLYEVLAYCSSAAQVGLNFSSLSSVQANEILAERDNALGEAQRVATERLAQIQALNARIDATDSALCEAQQFATERLAQIQALNARIDATDNALGEAQRVATERFAQIQVLNTRIDATDSALCEAQQFATERLAQIQALNTRIDATDNALGEAQRVATERLAQIQALNIRIDATDSALCEAQQFATERLAQIQALNIRIDATDNALGEAQRAATERFAQIQALNTRIDATDSALGEAHQVAAERLAQITILDSELIQARNFIASIEQSKRWRLLRLVGLIPGRRS